jgi:hypothetical protein
MTCGWLDSWCHRIHSLLLVVEHVGYRLGAPKDVDVLISQFMYMHPYAGTSLLLRGQDICISRTARTHVTPSVAIQTQLTTFGRLADCEHAHNTAYRSAPLIPIPLT